MAVGVALLAELPSLSTDIANAMAASIVLNQTAPAGALPSNPIRAACPPAVKVLSFAAYHTGAAPCHPYVAGEPSCSDMGHGRANAF